MAIPRRSSGGCRVPISRSSTPSPDPARRTLAIETATAACSVALIEHGRIVAARHEIVGRGHAERLVPMIAEVIGAAVPALILVDCGPGSFTGVRVGVAAARALGLGWGAEVRGFSSLALLAVAAGAPVCAAVPGGHGELFVQRFAGDPLVPLDPLASLPPAQAAALAADDPLAGPGAAAIAAALGRAPPPERWPDARDVPRLPPALAALAPTPLYGRAPDAKIPR